MRHKTGEAICPSHALFGKRQLLMCTHISVIFLSLSARAASPGPTIRPRTNVVFRWQSSRRTRSERLFWALSVLGVLPHLVSVEYYVCSATPTMSWRAWQWAQLENRAVTVAHNCLRTLSSRTSGNPSRIRQVPRPSLARNRCWGEAQAPMLGTWSCSGRRSSGAWSRVLS